MGLRQLRCFVAVSEKLSFPRAAASMHMTQSAVWRQVKNLEDDLRLSLIENRKHALRLTPAGESLLADARRILEEVQQSRERAIRAASRRSGMLTLAATRVASSHSIPLRAISTFCSLHPDVDLRILSLPSAETALAVQDRTVDGAFVVRDMNVAPGIELLDIETCRVAVVMCKGHRLAVRPSVHLKDLKDEALFFFPKESNPLAYDGIMGAFVAAGVVPKVNQFTEDGYLGANMASINVAMSFSFRLSPALPARTRNLLPGNIVIRHIEDLDVTSQFSFASLKGNGSSFLASFVAILRDIVGKKAGGISVSAAVLAPPGLP